MEFCGHVCEFTGRTKVGSWFICLMAVFGFGDTQTPDMLVGSSSQLSLVVEGSVMELGCVSYDFKLDSITIPVTLNAPKYQEDVLEPSVVPHFDNHTLASRPILMDDNATPHRARTVAEYLQVSAIETLPWPAPSPDLNPIEHLWDILGRQVRYRNPPVRNLRELIQALHEEWQKMSI